MNITPIPSVIDATFDNIWINSPWQYDGNMPPEYIFPKTIDLPAGNSTDVAMTLNIPNDQLATDTLEENNKQIPE